MKTIHKIITYIIALSLCSFFGLTALAVDGGAWHTVVSSMQSIENDDFIVVAEDDRLSISNDKDTVSFDFIDGDILLDRQSINPTLEGYLFSNVVISDIISILSEYYGVDYLLVLENFSTYGIVIETTEYAEGDLTISKVDNFKINIEEFQRKASESEDAEDTDETEDKTHSLADIDQIVSSPITQDTIDKYNITMDEVIQANDEPSASQAQKTLLLNILKIVFFSIAAIALIAAMIIVACKAKKGKENAAISSQKKNQSVFVLLATSIVFAIAGIIIALTNYADAKSTRSYSLSPKGLVSLTANNATSTISRIGNIFAGTKKLFGSKTSTVLISRTANSTSSISKLISNITNTKKSTVSGFASIIQQASKEPTQESPTAPTPVEDPSPKNQSIITAVNKYIPLLSDRGSTSSPSNDNSLIQKLFKLGASDAIYETLSRISLNGKIVTTKTGFSGSSSDTSSISSFISSLGSAFDPKEDSLLYTFLFGNHDSKQLSSDAIAIITQFLSDTKLYKTENLKAFVNALVTAFKEADFDTINLSDSIAYLKSLTNEITRVYSTDINWQAASPLDEDVSIKTMQELTLFSMYPSRDQQYTSSYPIGIGTVTVSGEDYGNSNQATLILLSGTGFVEGQAYGIITDLLSAWEQMDSTYLVSIEKAITDYYKSNPGAPRDVIITGMSLGGMIAQQLIADTNFIHANNLVIKNASLIATPLLNHTIRESNKFLDNVYGKNKEDKISRIKRAININDIVPYFSRDFFENNTSAIQKIAGKSMIPSATIINNSEMLKVNTEGNDGPLYTSTEFHKEYPLAFIGTHTLGYASQSEWNYYDALGYYSSTCLSICDKASTGYYDGLTAWQTTGGNLKKTSDYSKRESYHSIHFKYNNITWYPSASILNNSILSTID